MSVQQQKPLATAAAAPPSLLTQVGMAGTAAVITVSFIHPIDVVKVRNHLVLGHQSSTFWCQIFYIGKGLLVD